MPIGGASGQSANGVNHDDAGAVALRLAQKRHDVWGSTGGIAAPDEYQLAMDKHIRRWRETSTDGESYRFLGGMTTNGAFQATGSQTMPEATIGDGSINQPQRSRVTIR